MVTNIEVSNRGIHEISPDMLNREINLENLSLATHNIESNVDSESLLKAEESFHRATAPNLRNLDREQALEDQIKASKTAEEKFPLVKELFKLKIEAFKNTGACLEDFCYDVWIHYKQNRNTSYDYEDDLKNTIKKLYFSLRSLSFEQYKKNSVQSPALQIFELEKETGFILFGPFLLLNELEHDFYLIHQAFHDNPTQMEPLYWNHVVPHFNKIFTYLENEQYPPTLIGLILKKCNHILNLCNKVFSTSKPGYDPFHHFFPLIVKYFPEQEAELIFKDRVKNLEKLEKSLQWINLHCQASELLASTDLNRALGYLNVAEKEVENQLWTYPYPFNNRGIEQKQKQGQARIEQALEAFKSS